MAYYNCYEENDDLYEPSQYDEEIQSLKEAVMKSIKKEILDELERLRAENEELKEFRVEKDRICAEERAKTSKIFSEYRTKIAQADRDARKARLIDLFDGFSETGWHIACDYEYIKPKCDKCDSNRRIHFQSPSGKELDEPCPFCSMKKKKYHATPVPLVRFGISKYRSDEGCAIYRIKDGDCYADRIDSSNVYRNGSSFEKINQYDAIFMSKDKAEEYCKWLDENKNQ